MALLLFLLLRSLFALHPPLVLRVDVREELPVVLLFTPRETLMRCLRDRRVEVLGVPSMGVSNFTRDIGGGLAAGDRGRVLLTSLADQIAIG